MILKQDKNLAIIADRAGKAAPDVAYILINGLLNAGLIKDDEEYYGVALKDCVDGSTPVATIVDILKQTGMATVNNTAYKAFFKCVVMGSGDCPECGGEMELTDCYSREISIGDRETPPEYEIESERWRCKICCHVVER